MLTNFNLLLTLMTVVYFTILGCFVTRRHDQELMKWSFLLWRPLAILAYIVGPLAIAILALIVLIDTLYSLIVLTFDGASFFYHWAKFLAIQLRSN